MKYRGTKALAMLLTLAMVVGLVPGMGLTAYAAPTETLLTTITATGKEQANYSTANVATVSFSYTAYGSSAYLANWGWWGYGWSATVAPANGYTITKCVFYDDANRTATDSNAPFVVETTEEDKTPKVNGTPILADTSKGIKKIEVYGYATPAHTHSFTYSASGATITATCGNTGCDITEGLTMTISAPTGDLTADGTKTFPATLSTGYNTTAFPGTYNIVYTKDGQPFNGTPTDAGAYVASVTVGTGNGAATASVSYSIAAPQPTTHTVTLSGGGYTTYSGGDMSQTVTQGQAMTTVIFMPNNGYHFEAYAGASQNGVTAVLSNGVITVSGTPTGDVAITIPAAVQDAPVTTTYKVTYVANNGSGDTREYNPNIGEIHTVEGQLFAAPQGKVFDNWLGDDNQTYRPGSQISTTRTLTAQWKDEHGGGNGEPGHGGNGDIVFTGGFGGNGGGDDWGGYVAPQRAYRVSFAPMQGGSAAFVLSTGESGAQMNVYPHSSVKVQAYPDSGYEVASIIWSLIDGSASYDITQAQTFVMPAMDVVVYVTFRPVA